MIISALLLAAAAHAAAPKPATGDPETRLRVMLETVRREHALKTRRAILGSDEVRDAVASEHRPTERTPPPFGVCQDLAACPEVPQSLHVDDDALINQAFLALARPWFKLQQARGKSVTVTVDPGVGVRLGLEALSQCPVVTFEAAPSPAGGFDVALDEGAGAARAYAAERALALKNRKLGLR